VRWEFSVDRDSKDLAKYFVWKRVANDKRYIVKSSAIFYVFASRTAVIQDNAISCLQM
jgi:hypothetical protein